MSFYFFAWIASILYGVEVISGKLISKYSINNPWLFNFAWNFFILIFTVPIALANHAGLPSHWGNLVLASLFYALGTIFYALALYRIDVSVLAPLYNFRTVFAVILSALMIGEILTLHQYLLITLMFFFGILVTWNENWKLKSFVNFGIGLAMLDMVSLALMGVFIKKTVAQIGYWNATIWIVILVQLMLVLTVPLFVKEVKKINAKSLGFLGTFALLGTLANLAVNKAYAENVSITAAIVSVPLSMVMAFLFSIFAPQLLEKHTNKVYLIRFVAAAIMFIAAIKLSQ